MVNQAMILTEKLYLTEDRLRAVKEGDPAAAFLLGIPGRTITDEYARRLGLLPSFPAPEVVINQVTTRDPEPHAQEPIIVNRDGSLPKRRGRPPKA